MKTIHYQSIVSAVADICITASRELPADVRSSLASALERETSERGRNLLRQCVDNANIAATENLPICQDTGFAVYFVEIGSDVHVEGGLLTEAIEEGTRVGYDKGYLRKSIVADPVFDRTNTKTNTPAVIHLDIVPGDSLTITICPKGGGSENMSALAMLKPSDGIEGVIDFVSRTTIVAGGNPCPPVIVGVGIGGTSEKATCIAKKALLRSIGSSHADPRYAALEKRILDTINASGVGPQGLGGSVTALAVHIETFPCHIASMPVAVCLNCHAARHATVVL